MNSALSTNQSIVHSAVQCHQLSEYMHEYMHALTVKIVCETKDIKK